MEHVDIFENFAFSSIPLSYARFVFDINRAVIAEARMPSATSPLLNLTAMYYPFIICNIYEQFEYMLRYNSPKGSGTKL